MCSSDLGRGCRVIAGDVEESRLQKARERGVADTVNMADADAMERLIAICNGGADIVVEASGSTPGAMAAYKLVRAKSISFYHQDWPRLIMQANYIEDIPINPFGFIPGEGITIIAPKDRGVEDRQKVVEAIRCGRIKVSDYVEEVLPFNEAPKGYARLQNKEIFSLAYKWNQEL